MLRLTTHWKCTPLVPEVRHSTAGLGAAATLGTKLPPMLTPGPSLPIMTEGVFAYCRHPMYIGALTSQ